MKSITITKYAVFVLSTLIMISVTSCKKSAYNLINEPAFGCDTKVVLENLTNTPGLLVYNPTQAEWQVSIDLGGNRKFSCTFCDKSTYSAKVAGQSTSSTIPVTVTGTVKRRYENQIPVSPTTGYVEVYILNSASVN